MKLKITLWTISVSLNLVAAIDLGIFIATGYYAFIYQPREAFVLFLIEVMICCTLLTLLLLLWQTLLPLRRTQKLKRSLTAAAILIMILTYGWYGIWFWSSSQLNFSAVVASTGYTSPNHQRELVFKKTCYFINCTNEAYENRGIFQRKVRLEVLSNISGLFQSEDIYEKYLNAFHDPNEINLVWSKDNNEVSWIVQVEEQVIKGIVSFA